MRLRVVSVFVAWLAVLTIHGGAVAQVARQGTAVTPPDPNAFTSPMVLEASFVAADRSIWGDTSWHEGPDYKALGKYTCDGVALRATRTKRPEKSQPDSRCAPGNFPEASWKSPSGCGCSTLLDNHDKLVTILVDVLDGAEVVACTTLGPIEVEDKGHTQARTFPFVIPTSVIKTEAMKIRLTMTTKDD